MSRGVERFEGPEYLTGFEPDPDAMERLAEIDSVTAYRLRKWVRDEWPGWLNVEDYLGPLAQAGGDIVYRVVDTPGAQWVYYRGRYADRTRFGRFGALPHYHDHKIVSNRNGHPSRLGPVLTEGGTVIPIHRENAPESIREALPEREPYERFMAASDGGGR